LHELFDEFVYGVYHGRASRGLYKFSMRTGRIIASGRETGKKENRIPTTKTRVERQYTNAGKKITTHLPI
ncbi:MAG: hypothetical protein KC473_11075, partial [Candidatus Dadabacteria bacterium]|nr:hypothetical protein [Candidatus Dadabacteria bacterium]